MYDDIDATTKLLTRDAGPKPHIAEKNPRGPYIVGQICDGFLLERVMEDILI